MKTLKMLVWLGVFLWSFFRLLGVMPEWAMLTVACLVAGYKLAGLGVLKDIHERLRAIEDTAWGK